MGAAKAARGQGIHDNVVLLHPEIRTPFRWHPRRVDVGGEHGARRSDPVGEPAGYPAAAGSHLQTIPIGADGCSRHMAASDAVERRFEAQVGRLRPCFGAAGDKGGGHRSTRSAVRRHEEPPVRPGHGPVVDAWIRVCRRRRDRPTPGLRRGPASRRRAALPLGARAHGTDSSSGHSSAAPSVTVRSHQWLFTR
jgi:hypothetical protein